jgi:sulfur carrier protein
MITWGQPPSAVRWSEARRSLAAGRRCCENPDDMKLQINGEARDFNPPLTLAGLVDRLGMKADRVAIELNRSIVARDQWPETSLSEGDRLEIVHFVGGG